MDVEPSLGKTNSVLLKVKNEPSQRANIIRITLRVQILQENLTKYTILSSFTKCYVIVNFSTFCANERVSKKKHFRVLANNIIYFPMTSNHASEVNANLQEAR